MQSSNIYNFPPHTIFEYIYKRAATPIIPATTPVRPLAFNESAAPVKVAAAGRDEVAEATAPPAAEEARLAADEAAPAAAEEARLAADEATAAAEEARLDTAAAALDARLEAEATTDETAAAEDARDATDEMTLAMGATIDETAGATGADTEALWLMLGLIMGVGCIELTTERQRSRRGREGR